MKLTTILAGIAITLATTAQAADESTSVMTLKYAGFTQTIPVGLDVSSTETIAGWTVAGTAVIYSGVAVITDAASVYMEDVSGNGGGTVKGGKNGKNVLNSVTVIDGTIVGADAATAAPSSSSTEASAGSTASTTASATKSGSSDGASTTGGSSSSTFQASTTSGGGSSSTSATTSEASSTPSSGAARSGSLQVLAMAGLGAAVVGMVV